MAPSPGSDQLTMIDLFAGCGGLSVGFNKAGFKSSLAVEYDLPAAATYAANFGEDHVWWGDIADLPDARVPEVDVVVGGPPCQGFSNLGTRDPNDPRNRLWRQYVRVLQSARPKVFVIENVDRFATSAEFELLRQEVTCGQLQQYQIDWDILNAADYGVPQRRRRTILVGSRVGTPSLPTATHARTPTLNLRQWTPVRHAIGHVPEWPEHDRLPNATVEFFGKQVPGTFKEHELHLRRNPTAISLARYDCVPPGGGRFDIPQHLLPACWRNKPTGTTDVMGRMRWDMPSLTIRTEFFKPEKGQYLHPQYDVENRDNRVNRPITHLEAARIQTFPRSYLWCGTKIEIARQIGNAVPCDLALAVAEHVRDRILQ